MCSESQPLELLERRGYFKISTLSKRICRYLFVDMCENPVCQEVFEATPIFIRNEKTYINANGKSMIKIIKVHSRDENTLLENLNRINRKARFRFGKNYEDECVLISKYFREYSSM